MVLNRWTGDILRSSLVPELLLRLWVLENIGILFLSLAKVIILKHVFQYIIIFIKCVDAIDLFFSTFGIYLLLNFEAFYSKDLTIWAVQPVDPMTKINQYYSQKGEFLQGPHWSSSLDFFAIPKSKWTNTQNKNLDYLI
jgi:hypothetical protein